MNKRLDEAFPRIRECKKISENLIESISVSRLQYVEAKGRLYVYLEINRVIDRSSIVLLERELTKLYFPDNECAVCIKECYNLTEDYSLSDVVGLYKDSMIAELFEEHPTLKSSLKKSVWSVTEDDKVEITIDKQAVCEALESEIKDYVSHCLLNRFFFQTGVSVKYAEPKKHIIVNGDDLMVIMDDTKNNASLPAKEGENTPQTESNSHIISSKSKTGSLNRGKNGKGAVQSAKPFEKDPNVIYGRAFTDETKALSSYEDGVEEEMVLRAEILSVETRPLRNGEKTLVSIAVTDYTDSIGMKLFLRNEDLEDYLAELKPGRTILVKGQAEMDSYEHEMSLQRIYGIMKYDKPLKEKRMDNAAEKRVELHAHTKYSENDAIIDPQTLVKTAMAWGHKAIALTDHGNVQAYTDAFHLITDDVSKPLPENPPIKVLYGIEGYLVDDTKEIVVNPQNQSLKAPSVVFDLETTGFSPKKNKIIEIGAVKLENGEIIDRFSTFVDPGVKIPFRIEELTGITNETLSGKPKIEDALKDFLDFIDGCYLVAHNAEFDMSFILENIRKYYPEKVRKFTYVDTLGISRVLLTKINHYKLDQVAKELNVSLGNHHRAVDDAECTAKIYQVLISRLENRGIFTVNDVAEKLLPDEETIRKMTTYHIILFARTNEGKVNLYRMVSDSNLKYFQRRPRIPKSLIQKNREGILIGSACSAGELYNAILEGADDTEIMRIVNFYDYLEIQPLGNNQYLKDSKDYDYINTDEDLMDINRKIIELGETYNKPVCATGDVHFLNPEDYIYRQILQAGCGFKEDEGQPPLYLHTTEEMLKEFSYLGSDKAYEVVIENPNKIADMIDHIAPVRPDKCPPKIENSDEDLRNHATQVAKSWYGDPLPDIVEKRLNRELNAIISNGYAVMYSIAHKLINKSLADGYLVGSRGSVGSSFAATMYNITEVNPLPPHYRCPNCKYSDFESETVKKYFNNTGWDMPDMNCPKCGTKMIKDGYNIPFETFMGFKGNKEPDIDLNFSGEYQAKAHAYTEVIFGAGQTYKAGTVGTVAEKTAAGYVFHYFEDQGMKKRRSEITRLSLPLVGVKRTTGQHPGGIIVLPLGEDINTFTPIQHPANDMTTNIVTTHYDYHSIDHNLLKLDILGHDDPTIIRMLHDLIGIDPRTFPLDAPEIMSLFRSTEALGIKPEDIHGTPLGVMGIPEFGTDNAIQMLLDTKPQYLSDLVRISGLAHGTNVWHGNAEVLIKEGKATIATAVCTRDDIMMYLIEMGVESETAFNIMEQVRKGKVAKKKCKNWPEWRALLEEKGVPDWYIWSCEHIEYMFPKAHAAAYVMMALRIAYCKVFYPLQYYCAYFSIRGLGFDYENMAQGKDKMEQELERLKAMPELSTKDKDRYRDIRMVEEMMARGYKIVPIDLYKVQANRFTIISDTELMPALTSIEGMGEVAADTLVSAAQKGPFSSVLDLKNRTKVSQSILDKMTEMHLLDGLPKENQISFFDNI